MRTHLLTISLSVTLAAALSLPAQAETLAEALSSAYQANDGIRAAQSQVMAASEAYAQAVAVRLPTLAASGELSAHADVTEVFNPYGSPFDAGGHYGMFLWQATATQVLYRGGTVSANIDRTWDDASSQGVALTGTVQSVLLSAAGAYLDLLQARANEDITRQNLEALSIRKEAVNQQLNRQQATVVDLDQATSRLEDAVSQHLQAQGALESARAAYRRWIGHDPLDLTPPPSLSTLPTGRDEAIRLAQSNNPAVLQAALAQQSAEAGIDVADGQTLPTVEVIAHAGRELDSVGLHRGTLTDYGIVMQISFPLYQGGAPAAQTRSAQEVNTQRRLQIDQTRDVMKQTAGNAWDTLLAAQADLHSRTVQQNAAEVALKGVLREQQAGTRSVLDTLNGQYELLNAQLAENKARHDLALSEYSVLAAIGGLTPGALSLPVEIFDSKAAIDKAGTRWFDLNALVHPLGPDWDGGDSK